MNVLLALGTVPTIVLGIVIGLVVGAAVFGLVFLLCILPDLKKDKKSNAKPAAAAEESVAEEVPEQEVDAVEEETAEAEEAVEILEEKLVEETEEESVSEPVEEHAEEVAEETVEESVEETVESAKEESKEEPAPAAVQEEVRTEAAATAAVEEDEETEETEEDDVEDNESEEEKVARLAAIESAPELENNQRYNRSFKARLIQSSDTVKGWYTLVKDAALSYKGTRSSLSWRQEKIYKGRVLFAKIAIRGKTLSIYFPLNVKDVKNIEVEDVSDKTVHAATPALFRIKKDVHAQQALELIKMSAEKLELEAGKAHKTGKGEYALQTTEQLVEAGLVKVVTLKK